MTRIKKLSILFIPALAFGAAILTGGANPASTATALIGANCEAKTDSRQTTFAAEWRAKAKCTTINSDSKVQGTLVRDLAADPSTQWFTTTGTWYYTGWWPKVPFTSNPTARYTVAHR
ncbi:MAG: hypothetical protein LBC97_13015 [Bifidobacteriaceae bacterium]|jgi:hypothetical protein|nr:hypothetical protein [Bifidobacteriaceae bacterium]